MMKLKITILAILSIITLAIISFLPQLKRIHETSANQVINDYGDELVEFASHSIGQNHAFYLTNENLLFAIGLDYYGRTCTKGSGNSYTSLVKVASNDDFINGESKIKEVYAGRNHSFILLENGILYACGDSDSGRTGLGNEVDVDVPTKVVDGPLSDGENQFINDGRDPVIQVSIGSGIERSGGSNYTLILTESGKAYSFGNNINGRTGLSTSSGETHYPTLIKNGPDGFINGNVIKVSAWTSHSLILTKDGTVYSFGSNFEGRTGLGTTTGNTLVPTKVMDGNEGEDVFFNGGGEHKVVDIKVSDTFSLLLTENGVIYSFGAGDYGGLGLNSTNDKSRAVKVLDNESFINIGIEKIEVGDDQAYAIKNGVLYSWGRNYYGQLGLGSIGDFNNMSLPKKVLDNIEESFVNRDIKNVSSGYGGTQVLKSDGTTFGFGLGDYSIFDADNSNGSKSLAIKGRSHKYPKITFAANTLNNNLSEVHYNSDIVLSNIENSMYNIVDIKLNSESIKTSYASNSNSYIISIDDLYEIVIEDDMGFQIKVNFAKDTVSPIVRISYLDDNGDIAFEEIGVGESIVYYNIDLNIEVVEDNIDENKSTGIPVEIKASEDNEGRYSYVISDKAGHTITLIVVIDITDPVFKLK